MARRAIAIFLLAAAGLLLQVSMTRILSLVAWHHFAYLIISLALLGIGAAGSYLTFSLRLQNREELDAWMARWAWLFALATILSLVLITRIRFAPIAIYQHGDWSQLYSLALIELAIAAPYFFAGMAMGSILSTAGRRIGGIYFSDLAGAALGSLLALFLINWFGAISSIFAAAAFAGAAALTLGSHPDRRVHRGYAITVAGALLLAGAAHAYDLLPIRFAPSKAIAGKEHLIETTRWSAIARVDVFRPITGIPWLSAGFSPRKPEKPVVVRSIFQDGAAPTGMVSLRGDPRDIPLLDYYLIGFPYVAYKAPRVMVIGVGGGGDLLVALHHGAESIVGVEVNPAMVDLLKGQYAAFSDRLALRPEVELRVAEGRHFVTADPRTFDVIQLTGVDTFTALSSGAYALTENFLYTVEAMHDFLEHLRPGGVVSVARWLFDPPRETLRLVSTQLQALEERGIEDASLHFLIVNGPRIRGDRGERGFPWAETLLKAEPFTPAQVERYRRWAEEREFEVLYDPFVPRDNLFDRLIRSDSASRSGILDEYLYDISPSTDDNPFFFQFYRWRNLYSGDFLKPELTTGPGTVRGAIRTGRLGEFPVGLIILFSSVVFIVVLSALFIAAPLRRGAGSLRGVPWKLGVFGYFGLIGLGFMFVEIVLLQKLTVFVGGPTYSMSITLASLLFFTGTGAALSRVVQGRLAPKLAGVIGGLGVVLGGEYLFLKFGIPGLLGLSHGLRCGVAALAILPLGVCLGMPFPVGLRVLDGIDGRLVPWAYGINGCASVLGGMVCIIVSMAAGLSAAWLAALVFYLGAGGVLLTVPRGTGEAAPSAGG